MQRKCVHRIIFIFILSVYMYKAKIYFSIAFSARYAHSPCNFRQRTMPRVAAFKGAALSLIVIWSEVAGVIDVDCNTCAILSNSRNTFYTLLLISQAENGSEREQKISENHSAWRRIQWVVFHYYYYFFFWMQSLQRN